MANRNVSNANLGKVQSRMHGYKHQGLAYLLKHCNIVLTSLIPLCSNNYIKSIDPPYISDEKFQYNNSHNLSARQSNQMYRNVLILFVIENSKHIRIKVAPSGDKMIKNKI